MTAPTVRHRAAPSPDGCRWCGEARLRHGRRWVPSAGVHGWVVPTRAQRLARMKTRYADRKAAR